MNINQYNKISHELVDSLKSRYGQIDKVREIFYNCIELVNAPSIQYINIALYNLNDICYAFNLEIDKIIDLLDHNDILYYRDSKGIYYVNVNDLNEMCILLNENNNINSIDKINLLNFNSETQCSSFYGLKLDTEQNSISQYPIHTKKESELTKKTQEPKRVSGESPRISMER